MTRELDPEILNTVRGMVVRLCHGHAHLLEHIDDACQEALIKTWECLRRYDPAKNDNFWGFACLSIRGAAIDYFRRQKLMRRVGGANVQMLSLAENDCKGLIGEDLSNKTVLMKRVADELEQLPGVWRYVLVRHCQDYRLREIGDDLGLCENRAWQIEQQSLARLRVRLAIRVKTKEQAQ
jgi:RNA polymerase sigma factor (sigma-70 family)